MTVNPGKYLTNRPHQASRRVTQWMLRSLLLLITFLYYPRLQNFTIGPIMDIARDASVSNDLKTSLAAFKAKKKKDLHFVKVASTLSAAATVGIFAWPSISDSFWVAKVFWYWSLSFSIFSLISSTISQLLEWIPGRHDPYPSEAKLKAILTLLIYTTASPVGSVHSENGEFPISRPRWSMIWVWQCPVMLMSWSWVLFYAGLVLHIVSPVLPSQIPSKEKVVAVTMIGCGAAIVNFFFCGIRTATSLQALRESGDFAWEEYETEPSWGSITRTPISVRSAQRAHSSNTSIAAHPVQPQTPDFVSARDHIISNTDL